MKKLYICLTLVLLCGCASNVPDTHSTTTPIVQATQPTTQPATQPTTQATQAATQPTQPATEPATQPTTQPTTQPAQPATQSTAAPQESFLQKVPSHDHPVFSEPNYDSDVVATVGQAGTYTIVEEQTDAEGIRWGKLKSGLGWIDLDAVSRDLQNPPVVTAAYGEMAKLPAAYHEYPGQPEEYTQPVVFHAYQTLTDVCLYSGWWDGGWADPQLLYTLDVLDADKPLLAQLSFPGDLSMFAISFVDAEGNQRTFYLSQNGRNNALTLWENMQ